MRRLTTTLALSAALIAGGATASLAQEWSIAHWVPAGHPLQPTGLEPWAKSIEEATEGRVTFTIYPAQQLGAAPDHYDMARDGIADVTWINPGSQPGRFPIIAAGELPFHITNAKGGSKAIDAWYREYAAEEMSEVYPCMVFLHDPGTIHSKEPVTAPADVRGKNVRPAHATMARFVNLLGGASVQVPAPEAREAIAKGAADMITFPWDSIFIFGIDSEVKHHLDMPLYATTFAFVINKDRLAALSEGDRQVIADHCTSEWAERIASGWADAEAAGRQKMIDDPSHTLHEPTPEEVAEWREAAAPLVDEWKAAVAAKGIDAEAAYQSLVETLKEHGAYYGE
jgi:TRAP-type C4-dicarboxylate transport system substrate-binding protein